MIKDFLFILKKTYLEYSKDKRDAYQKIKEIESLQNEWKQRSIEMKTIENLLNKNWEVFPILQRKDYIQKTWDLIHYGFKVTYKEDGTRSYEGGYDFGLIQIYDSLSTICINRLQDMRREYKQHNYKDVVMYYNTCKEELIKKKQRYDIPIKNEDE